MTDDGFQIDVIGDGPSVPSPQADTPDSYGGAAPKAPNSVLIPLGKGFVSWQSDNPIAVLALIMLVLILLALIPLAIISALAPAVALVGKVCEILSQAALTIVGAIIGSAATAARKR